MVMHCVLVAPLEDFEHVFYSPSVGADFWARQATADREAQERALRTTPTRELHVWVWNVATRKWVPGALAGWEHDATGRVLGQVVFAWRYWNPRDMVWVSHRSLELVPAERLRMVDPAPTPPPPRE